MRHNSNHFPVFTWQSGRPSGTGPDGHMPQKSKIEGFNSLIIVFNRIQLGEIIKLPNGKTI